MNSNISKERSGNQKKKIENRGVEGGYCNQIVRCQ